MIQARRRDKDPTRKKSVETLQRYSDWQVLNHSQRLHLLQPTRITLRLHLHYRREHHPIALAVDQTLKMDLPRKGGSGTAPVRTLSVCC